MEEVPEYNGFVEDVEDDDVDIDDEFEEDEDEFGENNNFVNKTVVLSDRYSFNI